MSRTIACNLSALSLQLMSSIHSRGGDSKNCRSKKSIKLAMSHCEKQTDDSDHDTGLEAASRAIKLIYELNMR